MGCRGSAGLNPGRRPSSLSHEASHARRSRVLHSSESRVSLRVAALVPAYQAAAHLGEVLLSLRALPDPPHVLVVDDGWRDATTEVARQHGVAVHTFAANRGKGHGAHRGLRATGRLRRRRDARRRRPASAGVRAGIHRGGRGRRRSRARRTRADARHAAGAPFRERLQQRVVLRDRGAADRGQPVRLPALSARSAAAYAGAGEPVRSRDRDGRARRASRFPLRARRDPHRVR